MLAAEVKERMQSRGVIRKNPGGLGQRPSWAGSFSPVGLLERDVCYPGKVTWLYL